MMLRRFAPAPLLALAIFACTPSVPSNPNTAVVTAEFDLASSPPVIPLPNTLAITPTSPSSPILHPTTAQYELLAYFYAQGGFPPDQVVPLDFPIAVLNVNGPGDVVPTAPAIDLATVVPCTGQQAPGNCNFFIFDAAAAPGAQYPTYAVSYSSGASQGTLRATPLAGTKPTTWRPGGQYFFALRGGASGIKTVGGEPLQPSSTTYTLLFGGPESFVCPSTVPADQCALTQLKALQTQYLPVFATIQNKGFPLADTVVVGTFAVAPATTWVIADPGSGNVPVPSDFLLDPVTNRVSAAAAAAFGIPGLDSLDGFSTTGMDIAQTFGWSEAQKAAIPSPVLASTIRSSTDQGVYLYKLGGATPVQVNAVVTEPPPITLDPSTGQPCAPVNALGDFGPGCVSTVVGLQPAVTVPTPGGPVPLPPLAESTEYAVILTSKIKDATGAPISHTTLGQILLFQYPICSPSPACVSNPTAAVSELAGVPGAQAALLEGMRLRLQPVVAQVAADHGVTKAQIAMPYTFRTQSITQAAIQLGAGPYAKLPSGADAFPDAPYFNPAAPTDPLNPKPVSPAAMAAKWGVPPALLAAGISTFVEANVITFDKLDPSTGAFNPIPAAGSAIPIPAIIAIPQGTAPAGGWPLVVFHHGLGRSRGDSLLMVQALAGNGMVVAAIDAAKHGARAWCSVNTQDASAPTGCAAGVTCDTTVFAEQQGDPPTGKPGLCKGALQIAPIACDPSVTPGCWNGTGGNSVTSGAFVVTANLFRSRDTIRQDILDQSMLVRVLTSANGAAVLSAAAGAPVAVNPGQVFYVGQSWGSIEGTVDLAANPRFSRAVLNVGGATLIDILTTAPSFQPLFLGLLQGLGIQPGSPEYLLFLIGAKWILDPADPANFAGHLVSSPLPNLLADPSGQTPQAPKAILGQGARCDATVPNPTNELLYGLIGLAPLDPTAPTAAPGLQWFMSSAGGTCPTDGSVGPGVSHGFLLDWATSPTLATAAQSSAVSFLLGGPVAPTPVVVP